MSHRAICAKIEVTKGRRMTARYFHDGEHRRLNSSTPIRRTVTETDNLLWSTMTHNPQPLHLDIEAAKATEFGQILVNSTFTLAASWSACRWRAPPSGRSVANLGFDKIVLPKPVFIGDTLRCESEVPRTARPAIRVLAPASPPGSMGSDQPARRDCLQGPCAPPCVANAAPSEALALPAVTCPATGQSASPRRRPAVRTRSSSIWRTQRRAGAQGGGPPRRRRIIWRPSARLPRHRPHQSRLSSEQSSTDIGCHARRFAPDRDHAAQGRGHGFIATLDALLGEIDPPIIPIATGRRSRHLRARAAIAPRRRTALAGLGAGARKTFPAAIGAATSRAKRMAATRPLSEMVRSLTLFAAHAADVAAIDYVFPSISDLGRLAAYVARARRDGFTGMLAIHPAQVAIINTGFTQGDDELRTPRPSSLPSRQSGSRCSRPRRQDDRPSRISFRPGAFSLLCSSWDHVS